MPFIDVTDLLSDTYIAGEKFTVYRRTEAVNQYGENLIAVAIYNNVSGQVSPSSPNSSVRKEAYTSQEKSIQVITTWPLTFSGLDPSGNAFQPDLVYWKNNLYIVRNLDDYTKYGVGFVVADCIAYDWNINITNIAPGTNNFVITSDGQFVITSDGQMVTTSS